MQEMGGCFGDIYRSWSQMGPEPPDGTDRRNSGLPRWIRSGASAQIRRDGAGKQNPARPVSANERSRNSEGTGVSPGRFWAR